MFKAIVIDKADDHYTCQLTELDESQLPDETVTVAIEYSTLNYKDGLAVTGASPVVRRFPMVPGIDFSGEVIDSQSERFKTGDKVFVNGWGLGEKHWGGLAQKMAINADFLLPLPKGLSTKDVMAVGTAGYTAMLCINRIEALGITPDSGSILVTGANGGVGSFAVAFLAKLGYRVVAVTGRMSEKDRLLALGASDVIERTLLSEPGRPLGKEQWAAAIDAVGSHTLANVCAGIQYGGVVAACGLAQGMDLPASVAPFILRGVTLAGVDSVMCPNDIRLKAWQRIANLIDEELVSSATQTIGLSEAIETAKGFLTGQVKGRVVVDVNA